eukprot:COSAG01_NODE_455_length_16792_cov_112.440424_14_plen_79_part_00
MNYLPRRALPHLALSMWITIRTEAATEIPLRFYPVELDAVPNLNPIESRWESTLLACAGQLGPRRLNPNTNIPARGDR